MSREQYERSLNEVANRLGIMPVIGDETFEERNWRITQEARQRNRRLHRWLKHEFSEYMDRLTGGGVV